MHKRPSNGCSDSNAVKLSYTFITFSSCLTNRVFGKCIKSFPCEVATGDIPIPTVKTLSETPLHSRQSATFFI